MNIDVSVIIPTFHRKKSLLRLLESLSHELNVKSEVIVAEQDEDNGAEVKNFSHRHKFNLQYIYLSEPSTTHAINEAVRKARGKYLLFLDDDVLVSPKFIEHHIQNFNYQKIAATCGRCITSEQNVEPQRTDTGRISWLGTVSDGFSSTVRQEIDTVIGCNTCWRKDVFERLGGMDERFTGNAMRLESDLSLRAKKAGYTIVFEQLALVRHLREETGGARKTEGRIKWYFDFFSNETYFFLKHRPHVLLPIFLLTKSEWVIRCMFGFGREVSLNSMMTPFKGISDGFRKYKELNA